MSDLEMQGLDPIALAFPAPGACMLPIPQPRFSGERSLAEQLLLGKAGREKRGLQSPGSCRGEGPQGTCAGPAPRPSPALGCSEGGLRSPRGLGVKDESGRYSEHH